MMMKKIMQKQKSEYDRWNVAQNELKKGINNFFQKRFEVLDVSAGNLT